MKNFLTIEGCEGVGKTYHTRRLKQYCVDNRLNVLFTREPGGSEVAEKIRNIILDPANKDMTDLCEAFLYASSRAQHLQEIVIPALKQGKTVFCDRFVDSSYAYQGVARGLGLERVRRINELAVGEYMPQYTLFLDLEPSKAFARKGGAAKDDRLELLDLDFHKKVYEGYKKIAESEPQRIITIDASGSKDETFARIIAALKERNVF